MDSKIESITVACRQGEVPPLPADSFCLLLCGRKKLQAALGGGFEHPGHELSGHGWHRRRTILNGIKRLFKERLQARGCHYEQDLCVRVAGVLKGMSDSAGEAN